MRVIVFDPLDMEALTVIDVPQHFIRELNNGTRGPLLRFAAYKPVACDWHSTPQYAPMPVAEVLMERFVRSGVQTWCAIARNPELCLCMRSELLPGQRRDAAEREEQKYMSGFLHGLRAAIGEG